MSTLPRSTGLKAIMPTSALSIGYSLKENIKAITSPSNNNVKKRDTTIAAPIPFVLSLNSTKRNRAMAVNMNVSNIPVATSIREAVPDTNISKGIPIPAAYETERDNAMPKYSDNKMAGLFTGWQSRSSINSSELKKYMVANRVVITGTNRRVIFKRLSRPLDDWLSRLRRLKDRIPRTIVYTRMDLFFRRSSNTYLLMTNIVAVFYFE
jgi:hypothetical protein